MRRAKRIAIATALIALLPSVAAAQTRTQGPDLNLPANGGFGCDTAFLLDLSGAFQPFPTGTSTCTAFAPGTGAADSHYVPGSGTITKVRVKSGPNPAPLRVTIIKQLFTTDPQTGVIEPNCCTGAGPESATFQPTPNAITEVPVNLQVVTSPSVNGGAGQHDVVSLSGVGPGELPISQVGPFNINATSGPKTQVFYPKVESGQRGQNEYFYPNNVLLMNFDWCGGGSASARTSQACSTVPGAPTGPGGTAPGGTAPGGTTGPVVAPASVRGKALRLRRGRVTLKVRCVAGAGQRCKGMLRMRTRGKKPRLLARKRVNIAHGKTARVKVKLSRKALRRVRKGRNKVRVEIDLGAAGKRVRPMILKR